jgi:diguanylate cyclase (GGDEF)-like protein
MLMPINRNIEVGFFIPLNLLIAILYVATGYFCLFLAVPPTYATAVWIPAGIALGAILVYGPGILPGIFIGAYCINLYTDIVLAHHTWSFVSGSFATIAATGVTLQAWVGWVLITRRAKVDPAAYEVKDILLFAILAGPVSCLINATFTNTALILLNSAPLADTLKSWVTWWAGDSIGALTITPMFLILFAQPRIIWKPRTIPILLPLGACFIIAIILASLVRFFEEESQQWEAYFVLMSGLLFCILMNIILSIIYGQKSLVEHVVTETTASLKKAMLDLEKMAHFDPLTDMPNRRSFLENLSLAIARASRNNTLMAVCIIDLDDFKQINDRLGHPHGDALLKKIPALFAPALRKTDFVARLGGDEFGLILENVHSPMYVQTIVARLTENLTQSIKILNTEVNTSLSVGIAMFPHTGNTAEILIKHADIAMYRAKQSGKSTYQFFNEQINRQITRLQAIDTQMHRALENHEFHLFYQPQFDAKSRQLIGAEALLRWENGVLGEVHPTEFIPVAEENNMIKIIGEWVLRKACEDFKRLQSAMKKKITLSVNISIKQLENDSLFDLISQLSEEYHFHKNPITLEITESSLLKNPDQTIQLLHRMQPYGVQFALDDFGTGYSSMLYLKSMPISIIKIDQRFIQNVLINKNDLEIVNATISLAKALRYQTVAEGVETKEQYEYLVDAGCDIIQGHYFAKAMSIEELTTTIEQLSG